MRGAAAVAAHRNSGSNTKHLQKSGASITIEADDDDDYVTTEPENKDGNDAGKGKDDSDYVEEEDHLYLFPPPSYRKGDISLGVLMSG
jgi:hypothetical protein